MDTSVIVSGSAAIVAGIVWLVRLEGRVNLGESLANDLKEDIAEIKSDVKAILWNGRHDH